MSRSTFRLWSHIGTPTFREAPGDTESNDGDGCYVQASRTRPAKGFGCEQATRLEEQ